MKFLTIAALICTASAMRLRGAPVPLSEAKPNAGGAVDSSGMGKATHEQAKVDQKVTGFMIADSDAVWKAASASKNKPISTQAIPTPNGPSLPIHNTGKAGNGDRVQSLAENPAWHCKCMGTTCWDHEGAACTTHQEPAHGGEKCAGGTRGMC